MLCEPAHGEIRFKNPRVAGNSCHPLWSVKEIAVPPQKPPRPAPPRLQDFPIRVTDTIRYADLDPQGHVNNAVFATYLESSRVAIIYAAKDGLQVEGTTSVLARLEVDFLRELHWPGTVEVGTAVAEIGKSSYTFTQGIFHDGTCAGTGRATLVLIDRATRRSRPLPAELVARLEQLKLANSE
jgi:acyl-CoA thioester hydrolase